MLIFNNVGILMLAATFIIMLVMNAVFAFQNEGVANMLIGGPVLSLLDVLFRIRSKVFFAPAKGGSLFFLPAWIIGILMLLLGILESVK